MLGTVALAPGYVIPRWIRGTWSLHERAATLDRRRALDDLVAGCAAGFTAFEAADTYDGVEDLLGALLREAGDHYPIRVHTRVTQIGAQALPPAAIRATVDRARKRLGRDRLDLVQLQWWNLAVPGWIEAGRTLADLARQGAIARLGVTNFPPAAMGALLDADVPLISNQIQASLLDPRARLALATPAARRSVKLLAYGPLAGGFLGPAWHGRPAPPAAPTAALRFPPVYRALVDRLGGWAWLQALLAALDGVARRHGVGMATVALAWLLQTGDISAVLVGIGDARRLPDILAADTLALDAADRAAIDAVLAARAPVTPGVADIERERLLGAIAADYGAGAAEAGTGAPA
jgi:aryl-alcohol dehydrogenase-like predicted oxidoreductase